MRSLPAITDPFEARQQYWPWLDGNIRLLLNDQRDLPFAYLIIRITLTMVPLGIALFFIPPQTWQWWGLAIAYFIFNNAVYKGPFGLMLHCTSHRKLFHRKYKRLNWWIPWVLAPFFGQTPETYFSHHIGMHHPEGNLPMDRSSTMPYQRDSLRSFLQYVGRFLLHGVYDLLTYLKFRRRPKLIRNALFGETAFLILVILTALVQWQAAVWVFLVPMFIFRVIAMLGNFTQHSFVDPSDPANPLRNSITCLNVKYNHKCWNDGYHASHHLFPHAHWSEHPALFLKHQERYGRERAIVFDRLDFLGVFLNLMRKRYDVLAAHLVQLPGGFATDAEAIAELKRRTQRIHPETPYRKLRRAEGKVVVSAQGVVA